MNNFEDQADHSDPFQEESDLQAWADEMDRSYEIGSQGSTGQPIQDMSEARIVSYIDRVSQGMRELCDLPILPDERERALHRTRSEINNMSSEDLLKWQVEAQKWITDNPTAILDVLIDEAH